MLLLAHLQSMHACPGGSSVRQAGLVDGVDVSGPALVVSLGQRPVRLGQDLGLDEALEVFELGHLQVAHDGLFPVAVSHAQALGPLVGFGGGCHGRQDVLVAAPAAAVDPGLVLVPGAAAGLADLVAAGGVVVKGDFDFGHGDRVAPEPCWHWRLDGRHDARDALQPKSIKIQDNI